MGNLTDSDLFREVALILAHWPYWAPLGLVILVVAGRLGRGFGVPNLFRDDDQIFNPEGRWGAPPDPKPRPPRTGLGSRPVVARRREPRALGRVRLHGRLRVVLDRGARAAARPRQRGGILRRRGRARALPDRDLSRRRERRPLSRVRPGSGGGPLPPRHAQGARAHARRLHPAHGQPQGRGVLAGRRRARAGGGVRARRLRARARPPSRRSAGSGPSPTPPFRICSCSSSWVRDRTRFRPSRSPASSSC